MTKRARKRLFVVVILLVATLGSFFVFKYVKKIRKIELVAQEKAEGLKYYNIGDYENALKHLSFYIANNKDDGEMLIKFAESRLNVPKENGKHVVEAAGLLRRAASLRPDDPQPLFRLVELYGQLGFLTERLDTCQKLLAIEPTNQTALRGRAETLLALGQRTDELSSAVGSWIAADSTNIDAHKWKLLILSQNDEFSDQQIAYARDLAQKYPTNIGFATLLAEVYARAGETEKAQESIDAALKLPINDPLEVTQLVEALDRLGQAEVADKFLSEQIGENKQPQGDIATMIIERAWKRGEVDTARKYLPDVTKSLEATDDDLLGWTAFLSLSRDHSVDDDAAYLELARRHSEASRRWVRILLGADSMYRADWSNARSELQLASRIGGGHPAAWLLLGEVNRTLGETGWAILNFQQATSSDPAWPIAQQELAMSLIDAGRLSEARIAAENAFRAKPSVAQLAVVAEIYIRILDAGKGDPQVEHGTLTVLRQLLDRGPDNPNLISTMARAYIVTGDQSSAQPLIQRLLDGKLIPQTDVLLDLIDACNANGMRQGNDLLALGGSTDSTNVRVLLRLANRSASRGRFDEGRTLLEDAIESAIDETQILERTMALATYLDNANSPEALPMLTKLAVDYPKSAVAQRVLLDSKSAWSNEDLINPAIERLKGLTGENASGWRTYEARKLLTFDPSEKNAATVVQLLSAWAQSNPADVRTQALLAEADLILKDRDDAIKALSAAVDSNLVQVSLFPRLIKLLNDAGRAVEARQRLLEFTRRKIPTDDLALFRRRAALLEQNAMWKEAVQEIKPLADKGSAADLAMLARLYERLGNTKEAALAYNSAIAADDVNELIISAAADYFSRIGDYARGLNLLQNLPETVTDDRRALLIGAYMERSGHIDEALQVLRENATSSRTPEAWEGLVRLLIRQSRLSEAEQSIQDGLIDSPGNPNLESLGNLLTALKGGPIADDVLDQLRIGQSDEEVSAASNELLDAERFLRANPEQRKSYLDRLKKVTADHPSVYAGWHLLTTEYLNQGLVNDAIESAQTAARVLPSSGSATELAAKTLIAGRRYDLALSYARSWHDLSLADSFLPDMTISFIEWKLGRAQSALERIEPWTERIQQRRNDLPENVELLATLLARTQKTDAANALLWPLVLEDATWIPGYARIAEEIASDDEAETWLDKIESLNVADMNARSIIVGEYYKLAQRKGTRESFQRVIDLASSDVENEGFQDSVIGMVADANQRVGNLGESERLYRLAIKRQPRNAVVMNNLAYFLVTQKKLDGDAEQLSRKAVSLAEEYRFNPAVRANFIETLGLILNASSKFDESIKVLREGLSLDTLNLPARLALVEAYIKTGQADEAKSELQEIDDRLRQNLGSFSTSESERLAQVREALGG